MSISRRQFLGAAGVGGAAVAGGVWAGLLRDNVDEANRPTTTTTRSQPADATARRTLVVVQCNGGNDALNTVVPVGDGRYRDLRPTLGVPEPELVALTGADELAVHPSLAPLVSRWEGGQLAVVQGVGFEGQSRSHFAAMDLWFSATPGETYRTGWLGRWLDATGDPTNPLRAVALGASAPALVGERALTTQVNDPAGFALLAPPGSSSDQITNAFLATSQPATGDPLLADTRRSVPAALDAVEVLAAATASTSAIDDPADDAAYAGRSSVSELLQTAAGIIELDLGTRVIVVATSGFDTHAAQAATHAALLDDVAGGVVAFLDRLEADGRGDDVVVVTTSEFGRRAAENASGGSDHGNAGTLLACGPAINGGVVGTTDLARLVDGDLPISIEAQSLYAVGLDWLGGPTDEILGGRFDRYGLLET